MNATTHVPMLTIVALLGTNLWVAPDASAHGRRGHRGPSGPSFFPAAGYTTLKAGGYGLDQTVAGADEWSGLFLGVETGITPSPYVQVGVSLDWLRRREGTTESLVIDAPYELPVHGEIELRGTSTDLVPLGGVVRLQYPVSLGRIVPYVSGHLTFDTLRLEYHELLRDGAAQSVARDSEYFFGMGSTIALGVEAKLDQSFGLLFEAGVHDSNPEKGMRIDGVPVVGVVDAGGEFVRVGMRLGFS